MKIEEISLVRKKMRVNPELSTKINSKTLNKEFKDTSYRFTMKNGKMTLIKNTYISDKDKFNDDENEILNRIKDKVMNE